MLTWIMNLDFAAGSGAISVVVGSNSGAGGGGSPKFEFSKPKPRAKRKKHSESLVPRETIAKSVDPSPLISALSPVFEPIVIQVAPTEISSAPDDDEEAILLLLQ